MYVSWSQSVKNRLEYQMVEEPDQYEEPQESEEKLPEEKLPERRNPFRAI